MQAMKKLLLLTILLLASLSPAFSKSAGLRKVPVSDVKIELTDARFILEMKLMLNQFHAPGNREYILTPVLVSAEGTDSMAFSPVIVAGRNLYYGHLRDNEPDNIPFYQSGQKKPADYSASLPLENWMRNATLRIDAVQRGCCESYISQNFNDIARTHRMAYTPVFNYIQPVAETVKTFELCGSAFINFPVNKTELYPDYMRNPVELAKITGTIDSVKGDPDVTITSIFIKGFASPEGPYDINENLAKERTATLKAYVENLYRFKPGFIKSDFMAENWPGLREYVENSSLANRQGLLDIIDSNLPYDERESKIKQDYPSEYTMLLTTVYPTLRRSDYVINYTVRSYTSLEDILRVLKTNHQKLSKEEFYRAAQSMEQGSDEYNEVFETAVRMYPDDEICNLNAANTAMRQGRFGQAARYLEKSGDTPAAIYARGVLAALQKDYAEAEKYFMQAARLKVADAPAALESVRRLKDIPLDGVEILN